MDAPVVAVLWQELLARNLQVHLNGLEILVLALSVWFLYLADHVLDALRPVRGRIEPLRKAFVRRHFRCALAFSLLLVAVVLTLAFRALGIPTLEAGILLGFPVALYFAAVHLLPSYLRSFWPREVSVSCLFAAGTFMAIWVGSSVAGPGVIAAPLLFAVLCWGNCCVVESWEWRKIGSPPEVMPSLTARWIGNHLSLFAVVCFGSTVILEMCSLVSTGFAASAMLTSIAFYLLDLTRARIRLDALSAAMDCAMCTPALYFAVHLLQ
jgi:hypothetical protein